MSFDYLGNRAEEVCPVKARGQWRRLFLGFAFGNRYRDAGWEFILLFRKPKHRALEFMERLDLHPTHPTEKRKVADAAVDVLLVQNGQAVLPGETGITECADKFSQLRSGEMRFGQDGQAAQIQHGTLDAALAAGMRQILKRFLARGQVQMLVCVHAQKFIRSDKM